MKFLNIFKYFILSVTIIGCGGHSKEQDKSYNGIWDVTYNVIHSDDINSCNYLVSSNIGTFIDEQIFNEREDGNYDLSSASLPIEGIISYNNDNNLQLEIINQGDIFGDGTYCVDTISISHSNINNEQTESLVQETVTCNDGFECSDRLFGTATRRPNY